VGLAIGLAGTDPAVGEEANKGRDANDREDLRGGGVESPAPGADEDGSGAGALGRFGAWVDLRDLHETVGSARCLEPPIATLLCQGTGLGVGGGQRLAQEKGQEKHCPKRCSETMDCG